MNSLRCDAAVLKIKDYPLLESLVSLLYQIDSVKYYDCVKSILYDCKDSSACQSCVELH